MPARLTVAVVTYNPDPVLLRHTVESLAIASNQARADGVLAGTRLLLVDNGPQESAALVREVADEWPAALGSAEVVSGHGNVGYGRGNNAVMGRLDSDFHLVMNPDVELDANALTAALTVLRDHPDVGLVAPAAFGDDGARQYLCKRRPSVGVLFLRGFAPSFVRRRFTAALDAYEMRDVIGDQLLKGVPLASGCFMLMRTALFRQLGGFDPRFFMYFEDYDLSLRVGRESTVAYVPGARIVHHGGDASRKGVRHIAWFVASAWKFFSMYGWR
ncbi:glycosyltransferase family 2 protein [Usitatibacter palustris]|uniref:N-acetylglucosaminyl-diphospho-decaprenol L-rhamnosyltransferase n=1 Tax=Usitatibacter palustris TaxID=2732487 RepID=A0A6M4HA90_9PROT|nr:glycosyltransferase family 2 protein [Usitatibacter palustris]QJR16461.1 N-acetylglucosaminyl-diphospho-decaprenol L-rhamnosyltransferase [Usitatibacter palustris]